MNKFSAMRVEYKGKIFDSKKERDRYIQLMALQKQGKISNLVWQKKFLVLDAQRENGVVVERPIYYIADFVYEKNGRMVVEDVKDYKGGSVYQLFAIKRKLMLQRYGIRVREI